MSRRAPHKVVVAGLGSEYRRDDGAGLVVADRVASLFPDVDAIGPLAEPLDLLGRWDDADLAVVIDTVRSGAIPGTITLIDLGNDEVSETRPVVTATSTHGIGLVGALRIARALECAPRRAVVVAIEGNEFGPGIGLSPAVDHAVNHAVEHVLELLEETR
jgi:hydrogenase maturation protease